MKVKPATAKISSLALKQNLAQIKQLTPSSKVLAVVKANAYGHGMLFVSQVIESIVDGFAVARIEEALALRSNGITKPILLLEGFFDDKDLPILAVNNIETVVHNIEQLQALKQSRLPTPVKVWLKIDTGMHRLGVPLDKVEWFCEELKQCPQVQPNLGFMSHLSRSDELDSPYTEIQLNRFLTVTANQQGERSIAASGGILFWQSSHLDWIRPGIILYGISPLDSRVGSEFNLIPVMNLTSSLIAVRDHQAGEPVGYGGIWKSQKATKIGVVAIGYGDGYPRNAPEGTPVYLNGRIVPLVGRVSMDMLTVDLGAESQDKVGDEVILWGKQLPIEQVASFIGVISYELITRLTPRVLTEYLD